MRDRPSCEPCAVQDRPSCESDAASRESGEQTSLRAGGRSSTASSSSLLPASVQPNVMSLTSLLSGDQSAATSPGGEAIAGGGSGPRAARGHGGGARTRHLEPGEMHLPTRRDMLHLGTKAARNALTANGPPWHNILLLPGPGQLFPAARLPPRKPAPGRSLMPLRPGRIPRAPTLESRSGRALQNPKPGRKD